MSPTRLSHFKIYPLIVHITLRPQIRGLMDKSYARARALLARVNAGSVYWNCCDRVSPRLPWSGLKHSGVGLTLSTYGIQTFLRTKAWHMRNV